MKNNPITRKPVGGYIFPSSPSMTLWGGNQEEISGESFEAFYLLMQMSELPFSKNRLWSLSHVFIKTSYGVGETPLVRLY
jgi:hypothetical protein